MSVFYSDNEFIFKTNYNSLKNDLRGLLDKAEDYRYSLKDPSEFDGLEKVTHENKIGEVDYYIKHLENLIDNLID